MEKMKWKSNDKAQNTPHFLHVGNSNYVSHKYRIFIPCVRDWPNIFRAVTYCHNTYAIDYDKVLVGGKPCGDELQALYSATFDDEDVNHATLCAQICSVQSISQKSYENSSSFNI